MAITITSQTSNKLVFRVQPLASNNATISEARVYIDDNIKQTYSVNSKDKTIEFNFNPSDYFEGTHNIKIRIEDYIGDYEYAYATFDGTQKRPALPTLPTNSTLTQSVQYITDVKNELLYQKNKLSTNLTSKGVVVLPTDKMSTLIDKVEYVSDIKIISDVELPSEVYNNTIFLKSNNVVKDVFIQDIAPIMKDGDVHITSTSDSTQATATKLVIGSGSKTNTVYVTMARQVINGINTTVSAWVGIDEAWIQFSFEEYIIFSENVCNMESDNNAKWKVHRTGSSSRVSTSASVYSNPKRMNVTTSSGEYADDTCTWYIDNTIDFTPFKKLYFDLSSISIRSYGGAGVGVWDIANRRAVVSKSYSWSSYPSTDFVELDVSEISGQYTIYIRTATGSASSGATLQSPKFYLTS